MRHLNGITIHNSMFAWRMFWRRRYLGFDCPSPKQPRQQLLRKTTVRKIENLIYKIYISLGNKHKLFSIIKNRESRRM